MTTSLPHSPDIKEVVDMRYCWLKDSIFNIRVFQKLASINDLEEYLNYLINIVNIALKRDLPIQTNYSTIYTKERKNEREANCLAGYNVGKYHIDFIYYFIGCAFCHGGTTVL